MWTPPELVQHMQAHLSSKMLHYVDDSWTALENLAFCETQKRLSSQLRLCNKSLMLAGF